MPFIVAQPGRCDEVLRRDGCHHYLGILPRTKKPDWRPSFRYNAAMRYRLRTLLILLALSPPAIWKIWLARHSIVAAMQRTSGEDWLCLLALCVALVVALRTLVPYVRAADVALRELRER